MTSSVVLPARARSRTKCDIIEPTGPGTLAGTTSSAAGGPPATTSFNHGSTSSTSITRDDANLSSHPAQKRTTEVSAPGAGGAKAGTPGVVQRSHPYQQEQVLETEEQSVPRRNVSPAAAVVHSHPYQQEPVVETMWSG